VDVLSQEDVLSTLQPDDSATSTKYCHRQRPGALPVGNRAHALRLDAARGEVVAPHGSARAERRARCCTRACRARRQTPMAAFPMTAQDFSISARPWLSVPLFGCPSNAPLDHLNGAGLRGASPAARSPPWRRLGDDRDHGRSASSIGVPLRSTSCCRWRRRAPERYCSQKEKATASCSQCPIPSTRRVAQKIRGNHSLRKQKPSPAGFLLTRLGLVMIWAVWLPGSARMDGGEGDFDGCG